jgi:hypothetical protein
VLTDLCVLEFDDDGYMAVTSMHDGTTREDIQAATGFPLRFHDSAVTEPATPTELSVLGEVDPTGLRYLEFVPGRQRRALIEAAIRGHSGGPLDG